MNKSLYFFFVLILLSACTQNSTAPTGADVVVRTPAGDVLESQAYSLILSNDTKYANGTTITKFEIRDIDNNIVTSGIVESVEYTGEGVSKIRKGDAYSILNNNGHIFQKHLSTGISGNFLKTEVVS